MSKQVTIKLSDGTPHTETLDPDGFLLLPRGAKPAEPWWSKCEADWRGDGPKPDDSHPGWNPCSDWDWLEYDWWLLRPLPGESWESIAPQQPAAPQQRDYTNWQEGLGDSAKPEDYDQQPGKYEVQVRNCCDEWTEELPQWNWTHGVLCRVRLRQSEPQGQKDFLRVDKGGPFDIQPNGESESDFMRRMLPLLVNEIGFQVGASWRIITVPAVRLPSADGLRLARLIAEAKA